MGQYKTRIADDILRRKLAGKGAVLIEGAKWCGKTTTAEQVAKSILYMSHPDEVKQNLQIADTEPSLLLQGDTPRLIDEWQIAPKLWDAIRFEVDHRQEPGQFILTGSAVPPETKEITHTGTGRFTRLRMRPMSLYESGDSTGTVHLSALFSGESPAVSIGGYDLERLAFLCCRGGWPQAVFMPDAAALDQAFDYVESVIESDIQRVDDIQKDPDRVRRLMRSYARHQGTPASADLIRQDIQSNDTQDVSENTIYEYLKSLKKIFVIEDVTAWNPNLRSKTAIRTTDTRYYVDPSIGTAMLGLGPADLLHDLETFGFVFETMCIRDLRCYAEALNGKVHHYRDKTGLECDAVIHLRNGAYGLIEIKLGGDTAIESAAATLKKFRDKIDTGKMKDPSFMMILTGLGNYAFRREDGIMVVPIGSLAP